MERCVEGPRAVLQLTRQPADMRYPPPRVTGSVRKHLSEKESRAFVCVHTSVEYD